MSSRFSDDPVRISAREVYEGRDNEGTLRLHYTPVDMERLRKGSLLTVSVEYDISRFRAARGASSRDREKKKRRKEKEITRDRSQVGVFLFGAACNVLATDIGKYTIGRLRPHFMTVCMPDVNCTRIENQHKYIENFTCTAATTAKLLKEIR